MPARRPGPGPAPTRPSRGAVADFGAWAAEVGATPAAAVAAVAAAWASGLAQDDARAGPGPHTAAGYGQYGHDVSWAAPPSVLSELAACAEDEVARTVWQLPPQLAAALLDEHGPAPYALGVAYEAVLHGVERRARGAFFTPSAVARRLVAVTAGPLAGLPALPAGVSAWDPACGGGAFLLAVADWSTASGASPAAIIGEQLHGCDIDGAAVAVARTALRWWAFARTGIDLGPPGGIRVADGLELDRRPERGEAVVRGGSVPAPGDTDRFDLVVGNPPFLNQLQRATTRSASERAAARARFGPAAAGYVDTATLFLLAAVEACKVGGRIALVQPESFLVAAHGAAARATVQRRARLVGLWRGGPGIFAAGVRVCAPVLVVGPEQPLPEAGPPPPALVACWDGPTFEPQPPRPAPPPAPAPPIARPPAAGGASFDRGASLDGALFDGTLFEAARSGGTPSDGARFGGTPSDGARFGGTPSDGARFGGAGGAAVLGNRTGPSWASLLGRADGPRATVRRDHGRLADLVTATAGFRDQYYGLVPFVTEADAEGSPARAGRGPSARWPLVTSGLIGPAWCGWGQVPTRFAKRRWVRPVVDVAAVAGTDPALGRWLTARLVPKVVVATQSRLIEAAIDVDGGWVPSVPVIAVAPREGGPADLGRIAAVLLAPAITALALHDHGGAGLSAGALRLSAKQVGQLPLPADFSAWDAAAEFANAACSTTNATIWRGHLTALGDAMNAAYQVENGTELLAWWLQRLPRHPNATVS